MQIYLFIYYFCSCADLFYINLKLPDKYTSPLIRGQLESYFPGVFAGQTIGPAPAAAADDHAALFSSLAPVTESGDIIFNLASHKTLYKCQYSLEEFFLLFGARGGVDLVHCAILEQKILFHSRDFSLLPMACECVRALMYPLNCCCVYIPVVPSTLLDLVEAPVPFILGIHSDWLDLFGAELLTDVLICDCNTGSVSVGKVGPELQSLDIPRLPEKLDRWLVMGLKYSLGYLDTATLFALNETPALNFCCSHMESDIQSIIQLLFLDALSSLFNGLPECLIFIDSEFPVFNKPLFLSEFTEDGDREFVSMLVETQSFDRLISTIQTPNLTFFCVGMERRARAADGGPLGGGDSSPRATRERADVADRQFPVWVYARVPRETWLNISPRCVGEFDNIKLLVDSRLSIYGYGWDGRILASEIDLLAAELSAARSGADDPGAAGQGRGQGADRSGSLCRQQLDVVISNDPELDKKRRALSGPRGGRKQVTKTISRKSKFFEGYFGGTEGATTAASNYDIGKTIEDLHLKKSRRGGMLVPTSFDGTDGLGSMSFDMHSGSFNEGASEKMWAMEEAGGAPAGAGLAESGSAGAGGNSFMGSFVGGELVVDPPVRFSKSTFQAALKSSGNSYSVNDVANNLAMPQENIINAFEQKQAGKGNITLRGSFVEGGAKQRDAMEQLSLTDSSADPSAASFTPESRAVLHILKAVHSGKVSSSFSHTPTMKLLQDSIYAMNYSATRKKFLQILSHSERGTYGQHDDDGGTDRSRFIQVDFEAHEVLVTLCLHFLSSCLTNKDYASAFQLLESVRYYFRLADVIGKCRKIKLGQTYVSFTRRSIFETAALNAGAEMDSDLGGGSDAGSSLSLELIGADDDDDDEVTGEKFTALRLAAYELADSKRSILKDLGSNSFKKVAEEEDEEKPEVKSPSAKKSVSFVPLAPLKAATVSQREGIIAQLSGHPIFQVLEFWQETIEARLIKARIAAVLASEQEGAGAGAKEGAGAKDRASPMASPVAASPQAPASASALPVPPLPPSVCTALLEDVFAFGLPGDLGAVCVQAAALRWHLTLAEYKALFADICAIWEVQAQLGNIDRAYDLWSGRGGEGRGRGHAEDTHSDDGPAGSADATSSAARSPHFSDGSGSHAVSTRAGAAATEPSAVIEIYGAGIGTFSSDCVITRRHTIHDIIYHPSTTLPVPLTAGDGRGSQNLSPVPPSPHGWASAATAERTEMKVPDVAAPPKGAPAAPAVPRARVRRHSLAGAHSHSHSVAGEVEGALWKPGPGPGAHAHAGRKAPGKGEGEGEGAAAGGGGALSKLPRPLSAIVSFEGSFEESTDGRKHSGKMMTETFASDSFSSEGEGESEAEIIAHSGDVVLHGQHSLFESLGESQSMSSLPTGSGTASASALQSKSGAGSHSSFGGSFDHDEVNDYFPAPREMGPGAGAGRSPTGTPRTQSPPAAAAATLRSSDAAPQDSNAEIANPNMLINLEVATVDAQSPALLIPPLSVNYMSPGKVASASRLDILSPEPPSLSPQKHKRAVSVPMRGPACRHRLTFVDVPVESGGDSHSSEITAAGAFDRWLVTGDTSGAVRVSDMKTGKVVESREHPDGIHSIVCLPGMEGYITCCKAGVINLWNYPRSPDKHSETHSRGRDEGSGSGRGLNTALSPSRASSGEGDGSFSRSARQRDMSLHNDEPSPSRWGMITGIRRNKIATLKLSPIRVTGFTTNLAYILKYGALSAPLLCAVGGSNGELRVFQKNASGFVEVFHHNEYNPSGATSSKHVCCVHLAVWEKRIPPRRGTPRVPASNAPIAQTTRSGMLARMRTARSGSNLSAPAHAAGGEGYLAVGSRSGVVECWDVGNQECIFSTALGHAEGHTGRVNALTVIMDESGKLPPLLFSGGNDRTARLFDFKSKRCCLVIKSAGGPVTCVSGGCGDLLYIASADGAIRCYSFKNGEIVRLIRVFRGHSDRIMSMEVVTENSEDVLRTCARDGTLRMWETGYAQKGDGHESSGAAGAYHRHVAMSAPTEATIILRPPRVPFMAINAFASSVARFSAKSNRGLRGAAGASGGEEDSRALFMAAGMSDGSICMWRATLK
jgi:WD40 repeat protein